MWILLCEFNKLPVICQRFLKMGCEGGRILRFKIPKIDKAEILKSPEQNSLIPKQPFDGSEVLSSFPEEQKKH